MMKTKYDYTSGSSLSDSTFVETPTIGRFANSSATGETFDQKYERICDDFMAEGVDLRQDINVLLRDPIMFERYKEALIGDLKTECEEMITLENADDSMYFGEHTALYDQLDQLLDNVKAVQESTVQQVGPLLPIKSVDYPLLVKSHLSLVAKDVLQTEVVSGPIIKKHIEQAYVVSNNDPSKRWRFPQDFYIPGKAEEIFSEGKGYPIKDTAVELPLMGFNIPAELTDAPVPGREQVALDVKITQVNVTLPEAGTTVTYTLKTPIRVDYSDGHFRTDGDDVLHVPYETTDEETGETTIAYEDVPVQIFGKLDTKTSDVTLADLCNNVVSVVFTGYLSNEKNERSTSITWERREIEFKIDDGFREMSSFSLEELQDTKALLGFDLYQRAYKGMADVMAEVEDSKMFGYLDKLYVTLCGMEVTEADILGWDGYGLKATFDCEPSTMTVMSPVEWISKMLKFKIDGLIADMTDMLKCDDYTFVIYGNPRIIRLLEPEVKWVRGGAGNPSSLNGVKLNYKYGIMVSQGYNVTVVSAAKVPHYYDDDEGAHKGLRIIPYPTSKEKFTMKHYKYTSNIETPQTSAYRDPNLPGGSKTYVMCTSRYTNADVQPIIVGVDIQNAERYISTVNK